MSISVSVSLLFSPRLSVISHTHSLDGGCPTCWAHLRKTFYLVWSDNGDVTVTKRGDKGNVRFMVPLMDILIISRMALGTGFVTRHGINYLIDKIIHLQLILKIYSNRILRRPMSCLNYFVGNPTDSELNQQETITRKISQNALIASSAYSTLWSAQRFCLVSCVFLSPSECHNNHQHHLHPPN